MFFKVCCWPLTSLLLGLLAQKDVDNQSTQNTRNLSKQAGSSTITLEQMRTALNTMVENTSFLSDVPFLEPLKKKIREDNKKESLLGVQAHRQGNLVSLGYWTCDTGNNGFSYIAKSANRSELHTIRCHFLQGKDMRWAAKSFDVSRTHFVNLFSSEAYDRIQLNMTMNDVIKTIGTPPGAFFAGEATFMYPDVRRFLYFRGTASEFQRQVSGFFTSQTEKVFFERSWISNDIAIWITFAEDGKVQRKRITQVRVPNEPGEK